MDDDKLLLSASPGLRWQQGARDRAIADAFDGLAQQSDQPEYALAYQAARLLAMAERGTVFIITNRAMDADSGQMGVLALHGADCASLAPQFFDLPYLRRCVADGVRVFDHMGDDYICAALPIQ